MSRNFGLRHRQTFRRREVGSIWQLIVAGLLIAAAIAAGEQFIEMLAVVWSTAGQGSGL